MFLGRLDGRHLGQMDEALAILREHAPEGLDAGFEHNPALDEPGTIVEDDEDDDD